METSLATPPSEYSCNPQFFQRLNQSLRCLCVVAFLPFAIFGLIYFAALFSIIAAKVVLGVGVVTWLVYLTFFLVKFSRPVVYAPIMGKYYYHD